MGEVFRFRLKSARQREILTILSYVIVRCKGEIDCFDRILGEKIVFLLVKVMFFFEVCGLAGFFVFVRLGLLMRF